MGYHVIHALDSFYLLVFVTYLMFLGCVIILRHLKTIIQRLLIKYHCIRYIYDTLHLVL